MGDQQIVLPTGQTLRLTDNGEGWVRVTYHHAKSQEPGVEIGLGRTRHDALASATVTLQGALNMVDLAILRGR